MPTPGVAWIRKERQGQLSTTEKKRSRISFMLELESGTDNVKDLKQKMEK